MLSSNIWGICSHCGKLGNRNSHISFPSRFILGPIYLWNKHNSKLVVLATNHIFSVICLKLSLHTWLCYWLHGIIQKCRLIYHYYYFYTFFWNYSYCCYHNHWWIKFFICFFDRLICLEARRRIELMLPCSRKSLK